MIMSRDHIAVIGGGVIGAMCAWYLVKSGHRVTIVERDRFGTGCSHGNCGYVSPSHILPLTQPGVIRQVLPQVWKRDSPLSIKLRLAPDMWTWLWKFARRCNHRDMMEAAEGRHLLLQSSLQLYSELVERDQVECEWTESGLLFVYLSSQHFERFAETNRMLTERFGVAADPLAGDELEQFEPALLPGIAGAWHYRGDRHLRPDSLLMSLRQRLQESGCQIVEDFAVEKFESVGEVCRCVQSADGRLLEADAFVVATGALTPFLNRQLRCKLPIQPGKGYSITMPHPEIVPRFPMVLEEHRVAITPMKTKYRIGSTMEFAGYDTTLNRSRLAALKTAAALYLRTPDANPVEEEWYGWRPMTWDGKPFIDRSPAWKNVVIAAGHNMLGISMATGTGKLVQEMLDDEPPHLPIEHFSLARISK